GGGEGDGAAGVACVGVGELSRCVLPWIALMRGAGAAAIIGEWKRLADLEPDPRVRLEYAADALMFAELPGVWTEWRQALEGWNVRVSQQVLEWQAEAVGKTRQTDLLRGLGALYGAQAPAHAHPTVPASPDPERPSRACR